MMKKSKPTGDQLAQTEGWGTWQKEPSEFPWYYSEKETCYVLEGKAMVTAGDGQTIEFGAGDLVEFEQGLECTWKITEKIVKKYRFG